MSSDYIPANKKARVNAESDTDKENSSSASSYKEGKSEADVSSVLSEINNGSSEDSASENSEHSAIENSENSASEHSERSDTTGDTCESEKTFDDEDTGSETSAYEPEDDDESSCSSESSSSSASSESESDDDLNDYTLFPSDKYYQCGAANLPGRRY